MCTIVGGGGRGRFCVSWGGGGSFYLKICRGGGVNCTSGPPYRRGNRRRVCGWGWGCVGVCVRGGEGVCVWGGG